MRKVEVDGGNSAWVQAAAVDEVRLPDEEVLQRPTATDYRQLRDDDSESFGTITLGEYWEQRCAGESTQLPVVVSTPPIEPYKVPYDSFTVDAEILVWRAGSSRFTVDDLASLLGTSRPGVYRRMGQGKLPAPAFPAELAGDSSTQSYWTASQAVEILAATLRRKDVSRHVPKAEQIVRRTGLETFTTAGIAQLCGLSLDTVRGQIERGAIPHASHPGRGAHNQYLWTSDQVISILAAHLRKVDAA